MAFRTFTSEGQLASSINTTFAAGDVGVTTHAFINDTNKVVDFRVDTSAGITLEINRSIHHPSGTTVEGASSQQDLTISPGEVIVFTATTTGNAAKNFNVDADFCHVRHRLQPTYTSVRSSRSDQLSAPTNDLGRFYVTGDIA